VIGNLAGRIYLEPPEIDDIAIVKGYLFWHCEFVPILGGYVGWRILHYLGCHVTRRIIEK
jgi:hypothetical protein